MKNYLKISLIWVALCIINVCTLANAVSLTGAGSSLPFPLYNKWAELYRQQSGVNVNYQSLGSGAGLLQIKTGTVNFASTEIALDKINLKKNSLIQIPVLKSAVVVVANLPGKNPPIVLDGEVITKVYLGKITRWNDPAIARLNPGFSFPDAQIIPIYRADVSGTTLVFSDYLSSVSPLWNKTYGRSPSIDWQVGQGAKGNEGITAMVQKFPYTIGYLEYSYAAQNHLTIAHMVLNDTHSVVAPTLESFQKAAQAHTGDEVKPVEGESPLHKEMVWPIMATNYILLSTKPNRIPESLRTLDFLEWGYLKGRTVAMDMGYILFSQDHLKDLRQTLQNGAK